MELFIDHKVRSAVDDVVATVENSTHDAILSALHKLVIPRIQTAVNSITGPLEERSNSEVQNPDRQGFLRNVGNTPLISASSRLNSNKNQDRNDETHDEKYLDAGEFAALRRSSEWKAQGHHSTFGTFNCN